MKRASIMVAVVVAGCGGSDDVGVDAGPDLAAVEGAPVAFAATFADGGTAELRWEFGDGTTGQGTAPTHIYVDDGAYTVTVTATVSGASPSSDSLVVTVSNGAPVIDLAGARLQWVPDRPYPLRVGIADPGRVDVVHATIDWGDGTTEERPDGGLARGTIVADHMFPVDGVYAVQITAGDGDGGTTTETLSIDVRDRQILFLDVTMPPWTAIGEPVHGFAIASDIQGLPLTLSLIQPPPGMTLDATGALDWTPGAGTAATHAVIVEVSDGTLTEQATLELVVSDVVPAVTATVGPAGGSLEVTDPASALFGVRLDVPAGALAAPTEISLAALSAPPPSDDPLVGPVVEIIPSGLVFAVPASLRVPYDVAAAGTRDVAIETYVAELPTDGAAPVWLRDSSAADPVAGVVTASLAHASPHGPRARAAVLFSTAHFDIRFQPPGDPDAPLPDCPPGVPLRPGCFSTTVDARSDVPGYVEFLGQSFETAYAFFDGLGYPVVPVDGRMKYDVVIKSTSGGLATTMIDHIEVNPQLAVSATELALTVAHELFHSVQFHAWCVGVTRPCFNAGYAGWNENQWLVEGTAEFMGSQVFPHDSRTHLIAEHYLGTTPIDLPTNPEKYFGHGVFSFLELRPGNPGYAMVLEYFNKTTPWFHGSNLTAASGAREVFYDRLAVRVVDPAERRKLWLDFGFAFQYSRSDRWIDRIRTWMAPYPTSPPTPPRAVPRPTSNPSGWEREAPEPGSEQPPKPMLSLVTKLPRAMIGRGSVATFVVNLERVLCPTPGAMLPDGQICVGTTAIPVPASWDVVLRPVVPTGAAIGVYRMPLEPGDVVSDPDPLFLGQYRGPLTAADAIRVSLADVEPGYQLVVTAVNDPDGPVGTLAVELAVAFEKRESPCSRLAIGGSFGLAVGDTGNVVAWGRNTYGQLGLGGTDTMVHAPAGVPGLSNILCVAAGGYHALALRDDGAVFAWGLNDEGQLGDGTTTDRPSVVQLASVTGAISIATAYSASFAVTAVGTVYGWGYNGEGQLGIGTADFNLHAVPTPLALGGIRKIEVSDTFSFAIDAQGALWGWGWNTCGQAGDGTSASGDFRVNPAIVMTTVRAVGVGGCHNVVLRRDGTLQAWGRNVYGELGGGFTSSGPNHVSSPVTIAPLLDAMGMPIKFVDVEAGQWCSAALTDDGQVWTWGRGDFGELGDGLVMSRALPGVIPSLTGVLVLRLGLIEQMLAIDLSGAKVWGKDPLFGADLPVPTPW